MTGQILGTGLFHLNDGRTSCLAATAATPSASHYLLPVVTVMLTKNIYCDIIM